VVTTMCADRAAFLARVRQATGRDPQAPLVSPPAPPLPSAPYAREELVQRFALALEAALGKAHLVSTAAEGLDALRELLAGSSGIARTSHRLLDQVGLDSLNLPALPPDRAEWAVSGCEFAVAATGSVVLSSASGRAVTLLPPKHAVVLQAGQILTDINDLYLELSRRPLPGAWGMHTGPSRSADIEQTMALGVHGPGVVHAIVISGPGLSS
jgi:L-lactate dehydrogenase complex protein LldG